MKRTFQLIVQSKSAFIIRLIAAILIPFFLTKGINMMLSFSNYEWVNLSNLNDKIIMILGIGWFIGLFYFVFVLSKRIFLKLLQIDMNSEFVKFSFSKNFFSKKKQIIVNWKDVCSYENKADYYFKNFKILDKNDLNFGFSVENGEKDDYYAFTQAFEKKVHKINQSSDLKTPFIADKNFYNNKLAFIVAILLIIIMISLPLIIWFNQAKIKWGILLIFYSGSALFIYQVVTNRWQRRG